MLDDLLDYFIEPVSDGERIKCSFTFAYFHRVPCRSNRGTFRYIFSMLTYSTQKSWSYHEHRKKIIFPLCILYNGSSDKKSEMKWRLFRINKKHVHLLMRLVMRSTVAFQLHLQSRRSKAPAKKAEPAPAPVKKVVRKTTKKKAEAVAEPVLK